MARAFQAKLPCRFVAALLMGCAAACGADAVSDARSPKPAASAAGEAQPVPEGSLSRRDVVRVVDAGLGRFLQRARVEPALEEGRFVGFRIIELVPDSFWGNADLQQGDVVTHVNDTSIEDPNQAHAVFESLREAPAIEVRLIRDGQPRRVAFPIVGPKPARAEAPHQARVEPKQ